MLGGLLAAYLAWLVVRGPQALQLGVTNGWVGTAFRLAAGVVCLIFGLRQRRGSWVPLVFGVALIFTAIGNTILTLDSLHGPPPPPPTPADFFLLGFIVLCFAGIGLMAQEDRQRLSPRELLDGGIAALGAGAVGAGFALDHIARIPGESSVGAAFQLADAIGFVVLVLLVVGAATVAAGQSRLPWVALTAAFVLLAVGSGLGAALGMTVAVRTLTEIQWPLATLLIAAAMWAEPGAPDPLAVRRGVDVWIPALAGGAAVAVLLAATLTRVNHTATALAAAALVLVMVRGYSELRREIGTRQRTEKSLRISEAGYRRVADEQAALRRVATLVARGVPAAEIFDAVAEEVHALLHPDITNVVRREPDGSWTYVALRGGESEAMQVGRNFRWDAALQGLGDMLGGRSIRVDAPPAGSAVDDVIRMERMAAWVAGPIMLVGRPWGALAVVSRQDPLPVGTEERLAAFGELLATAIANAESRAQLVASRARIITAADEERGRVVRDLHDGAQQHLVGALITLKAAQRALTESDPDAGKLLDDALERAEEANLELRELAHGILPAALRHGGLRAGVQAVVSRMSLPVHLDVSDERFPAGVESTAYFVVSEALTNVAKHAHANSAEVMARVERGVLRVEIHDDGVGGVHQTGISGLSGLEDRASALEGSLTVESPPGQGTCVRALLPLPARF
ncbi:MAG: GAF domain-containing sensor histidine kinase, partial [Solirubrobacteraceae bacterium]